ncbi:MAD2L1-binding protein [Nematolebias whitei]|uniref:MAD2L1-binding protein n=1 Tax=Nematolebias whitei TaxID=451745 RepID=UPI001896CFE1|nr:MAD2L1-binding protein [Nematolebias whitei]
MMQRGHVQARTFKNMAEPFSSNSEYTENVPSIADGDGGVKKRLSFSFKKNISLAQEPNTARLVPSLQIVCRLSAENAERLPSEEAIISECTEEKNAANRKDVSLKQNRANNTEDKENAVVPPTDITEGNASGQESRVTASQQHPDTEERDAEVVRRAREEGCVNVVFPGVVTQNSCYHFVSEILKCILYQRQQLPMTYDQLVYSQKKQQTSVQDKDAASRRPAQSADMERRKCQQTLQELEEVLQQLEVLFSLSRVPRVLLLMGGSVILPMELYEINMEALVLAAGDQSLRVSSCLKQLFRTLFVADILSDTRPVRLMPTTVLALAHRDCGVGWFRPKLHFKVPTRVKNQIIALSTDPSTCKGPGGSDWQDFVWFQAPMAIKGFRN